MKKPAGIGKASKAVRRPQGNKRLGAQTRKILGKHYAAKYRSR